MKFNRLPVKVETQKISPEAQLMYLYMYKCRDYETSETFASVSYLSKQANISMPSANLYIKELLSAGYIEDTGRTKGRSKIYKLKYTNSKFFEKFDDAFLNNKTIKYKVKATYVATQSFLLQKDEGFMSTTYSIRELSEKVGVPERTLQMHFEALKNDGLLTTTERINPQTGAIQTVRSFDLNKLGQFVLCQTIKNTEDIKDIKSMMDIILEKLGEKEAAECINKFNAKKLKEQEEVIKKLKSEDDTLTI